MSIEDRLSGSRDSSPSGQRTERFTQLQKALQRAGSAEEMAQMLKTNELGLEIDLEKSRNPNFQRDATIEDLLYDWATMPIHNPGNEDTSTQEQVMTTVLDKLKEFDYQPPEDNN